MKLTWMKWSVWPVAVLVAGSVAMAQDQPAPSSQPAPQAQSGSSSTAATPATPGAKPKPAVAQRKENQQERIAEGVKSGQLTAGETSKLETKEAAINGETKADRAANGGKLTAAEKKQINGQQNQLSKQIYKDKHNASTQHYGNNKVDKRRENQQERIAQGVKSGQLTPRETAHLEGREAAIHKEVHNDRVANGGKLTPAEKAKVNRQENRTSRAIYRQKHDAQHR